jgi:hypothetical protein
MKKAFITAGFCLLIAVSCHGPKKILATKNLFFKMRQDYSFNDYAIVLKTVDSTFYLTNAQLTDSGTIVAIISSDPPPGKSIILYTDELAKKKISRLPSEEVDIVQFNDAGLDKITVKSRLNSMEKRIWIAGGEEKERKSRSSNESFLFIILAVLASLLVGFLALIFYDGCFIATMVYGSYDAPEVLVLRRFRDEKLAPHLWGRMLIKLYYGVSPLIVKIFRNNQTVKRLLKGILDPFVNKLEKNQQLQQSPIK